MLGGYQTTLASMFPSLKGITPDEQTLKDGELAEKWGKTVKISDYRVEVFDFANAKDRTAYSKRVKDLLAKMQVGRARIVANSRNVLTRENGSTGWFGCLEWMEYKREDSDVPPSGKTQKGRGE